jgi:hypothetical protein
VDWNCQTWSQKKYRKFARKNKISKHFVTRSKDEGHEGKQGNSSQEEKIFRNSNARGMRRALAA